MPTVLRLLPAVGLVFLLITGLACRRPESPPTPTPPSAITPAEAATPTPTMLAAPSPTATTVLRPTSTPEVAATPSAERWTSGWPQGQATNQITVLAVAPSSERNVYASTSAGLYRSMNGGETWTMDSALPNIAALEVDPRNSDTLYAYFWPRLPGAPSEPKGFRKSTDGGKTWSDPSKGTSADVVGPLTALAIDPTNPATILIGTAYYHSYGRVLRSTDGGANWQVTYTINSVMGAGDMTAIAVHPMKSNVVYATHTVYHGGSVVRSDDGGLSWRFLAAVPMALSFPAGLALDPTNADLAYVSFQALMGGGVSVYRTSNGGVSWTKTGDGLPEGPGWVSQLAINPADPQALAFSLQGDNGGIYGTVNRGASWAKLSPEGASQFEHVSALGYSADGRLLYAGTGEGVWQLSASSTAASRVTVQVYFLNEPNFATGTQPLVTSVSREVDTPAVARGALEALFAGPTAAEQTNGLRLVTSGATGFADLSISNGIARVRLVGGCDSRGSTFTIAQEIIPTLLQFPTIQYVKILDARGDTEIPEGLSNSIPWCLEP